MEESTYMKTIQSLDTSRAGKLDKLKKMSPQAAEAIEQAAKEFEQVFLAQMLQPMFEGTELPEPFGGGFSEEMYRSLLLDEYAKIMAQSGGVGIADHVKRELIAMQEVMNDK